jgi:hypothetical protein
MKIEIVCSKEGVDLLQEIVRQASLMLSAGDLQMFYLEDGTPVIPDQKRNGPGVPTMIRCRTPVIKRGDNWENRYICKDIHMQILKQNSLKKELNDD